MMKSLHVRQSIVKHAHGSNKETLENMFIQKVERDKQREKQIFGNASQYQKMKMVSKIKANDSNAFSAIKSINFKKNYKLNEPKLVMKFSITPLNTSSIIKSNKHRASISNIFQNNLTYDLRSNNLPSNNKIILPKLEKINRIN